LIDDRFVPRAAAPRVVGPFECIWRDDLARSVDVLRLESGRGIGHRLLAIDDELIEHARCGLGGATLEPLPIDAVHGTVAAAREAQGDLARLRCEQPKDRAV